jgi:molybdopterin molybdotransferase
MISLEEAKERILSTIRPIGSERLLLKDARGRFSAGDLHSNLDLPLFDNSAMDGYAVRSQDLKHASAAAPVFLHCAGRIAAGEPFDGAISSGECLRLFTGSLLPQGADAVVMQEDVALEGTQVGFSEPVKPLENVRLKGEDIRSGTLLVPEGERLNATRLGLLAAIGINEVRVGKLPAVALLATGNELREPGERLRPGELYESNRTLLSALLSDAGCHSSVFSIVRDDLNQTTNALAEAFSRNDLVISTGGVSVGEFDFVRNAFSQLGGQIEFWKLSVRPGKPFVFGRWREKFLFGLPGNPVSALVGFLILVRPALLKMQGARALELPGFEGELTEPVTNRGERRHFMRVRLENGKVRVTGPQSSHIIGAMTEANGLIDVPPETHLNTGSIVRVYLWELPLG